MTAYRSLVIAALLGVGIAQKADEDPAPAPQENDGDCEPGYSLMPSGDCRGDPCNVEESVRAPHNGGVGSCEQREFEFIHLRPNPIDESDIAASSIAGDLGAIGIPFSDWTEAERLSWSDGAVFWTDPDVGPDSTQGIQVAQITVATGTSFTAVLNFQGRTFNGCTGDDSDSNGGCIYNGRGGDWQELQVQFSNIPAEMESSANSYEFVIPQIAVIAGGNHAVEGLAGYTTYKLVIQLKDQARNVYAVYGSADNAAELPPCYQVNNEIGGVDFGGTHRAFWDVLPELQFDSYITLGAIDMDHPDVLEQLHMLGNGEGCEVTCDSGYTMVGHLNADGTTHADFHQPTCRAGVITMDVFCVDGSATVHTDDTNEDIHDDAQTTIRSPSLLGAAPEVENAGDADDASDDAGTSEPDASGTNGLMQIGAAACALLTVAALIAALVVKQRDAVGVSGTAPPAQIFQEAGQCNNVQATPNALFSGFTLEAQ